MAHYAWRVYATARSAAKWRSVAAELLTKRVLSPGTATCTVSETSTSLLTLCRNHPRSEILCIYGLTYMHAYMHTHTETLSISHLLFVGNTNFKCDVFIAHMAHRWQSFSSNLHACTAFPWSGDDFDLESVDDSLWKLMANTECPTSLNFFLLARCQGHPLSVALCRPLWINCSFFAMYWKTRHRHECFMMGISNTDWWHRFCCT